jgi:hypothetical protein
MPMDGDMGLQSADAPNSILGAFRATVRVGLIARKQAGEMIKSPARKGFIGLDGRCRLSA